MYVSGRNSKFLNLISFPHIFNLDYKDATRHATACFVNNLNKNQHQLIKLFGAQDAASTYTELAPLLVYIISHPVFSISDAIVPDTSYARSRVIFGGKRIILAVLITTSLLLYKLTG